MMSLPKYFVYFFFTMSPAFLSLCLLSAVGLQLHEAGNEPSFALMPLASKGLDMYRGRSCLWYGPSKPQCRPPFIRLIHVPILFLTGTLICHRHQNFQRSSRILRRTFDILYEFHWLPFKCFFIYTSQTGFTLSSHEAQSRGPMRPPSLIQV